MKILHLAAAITWRGGEQQVAWLIDELKALGHASMVFCAEESAMEKYCKQKGILFESFKLRSGISFSAARGLKKSSNQYWPDIIHLHDSHAHTFGFMSTVIMGLNVPMVLSRRVDFPIGTSFLSRWKYNHVAIKKIICVSNFIEQMVRAAVRHPEKVMTIHSGIDEKRFAQSPSGKLRKLLNINVTTPLIGNVAALAPHKDHITFVKACALILKHKPEAQVVIIGGDGGEEKRVLDYIQELGLSEKIILLGYRDDVPELLADLDVFMFSSKEEGLGTSVIDALSAGIPVVSTAAGGIPEIIQMEYNGWLAAVGDEEELAKGVMTALDHPEIVSQWKANGKLTVDDFSKTKTARKTLTVYNEFISS